jgi:hypothetical protein
MSAHFHSGGVEFAYSGDDLSESVGESVKSIALVVVREGAAKHLQRVLGSLEGIDEAVEAGTKF